MRREFPRGSAHYHAAATSLGQAVGSAVSRLLFGVAYLPEASVIVAVTLLVVLVATTTLPRLLDQQGLVGAEPRHFPIEATDIEERRAHMRPLIASYDPAATRRDSSRLFRVEAVGRFSRPQLGRMGSS